MRGNLLLATVFTFLGFLLGLLYFVFLNISIQIEPFATWSELPYGNMFMYAGLVCSLGAVIFLLLEAREGSD